MKWFLTGIGLGSAIGIMLAPESGSETRKKLMTRAAELANRVEKRFEGVVQVQRGTKDNEASAKLEGSGSQEIVSPDPVAEVINSASKTQLRKVPGIGDATARRIIESRPFESEAEVVESKVMPDTVLKKLKDKLVDTDEGVA